MNRLAKYHETRDPKLLQWVAEVCNDCKAQPPISKVMIRESEHPHIEVEYKGKKDVVLYLSTDTLCIFPPLPLKAYIAHEIDRAEAREKPHPVPDEGFAGKFARMRAHSEREHHADARGAMTEGGAFAMAEAKRIMHARHRELRQSARVQSASSTVFRGTHDDAVIRGGR